MTDLVLQDNSLTIEEISAQLGAASTSSGPSIPAVGMNYDGEMGQECRDLWSDLSPCLRLSRLDLGQECRDLWSDLSSYRGLFLFELKS